MQNQIYRQVVKCKKCDAPIEWGSVAYGQISKEELNKSGFNGLLVNQIITNIKEDKVGEVVDFKVSVECPLCRHKNEYTGQYGKPYEK